MKKELVTILAFCLSMVMNAKPKEYDMKNFPKGQTLQEIGARIAEKYLKTAHFLNGNTHPKKPQTQIIYPDLRT